MHRLSVVAILLSTLAAGPLLAQDEGQVQIPLSLYEQLLRSGSQHAPIGYALGSAQVSISAAQAEERVTARVDIALDVQILEDRWTLVPLIPGAAGVTGASANGSPIQLVSTPTGLAWATATRGTYRVQIGYNVEASRFDAGYSLAIPLPQAPSSNLDAWLPGVGLSVAVLPTGTTTIEEVNGSTYITGTLPAGNGVQLTWRTAGTGAAAGLTRADYVAVVGNESALWTAELRAALPSDETAWIPLLRADVALIDVLVDGTAAPIEVRNGYFTVAVRGAGEHVVTVRFETPILEAGAVRLSLGVPRVPISRFELQLEGEKEVTVNPAASVAHVHDAGRTVATVNIPVTDAVGFTWTEAVPDAEVVEQALVNAILYHLAHAEEGVLYVRTMAVFEVARGETSQFSLTIPAGVQISSITGITPGLADWRPAPDDATRVNVFLDRQVTGEFRFDVLYEQLIGTGETARAEFPVPLLFARDVNRQRGMVSLLSSRDLTLQPVTETNLTRVGENQLPAFVREAVTLTVAHTFRYFETGAVLTARATPPERRQGLFDARIDTLISLGDVTLSGAATIDIDVKQGSVMDLRLRLPAGVNVLSLSAPSLRNHETTAAENGEQIVSLSFTQEMEGQFRVELLYERIMDTDTSRTQVPLVHVEAADVEQGRIAIEALSAVEVQPALTEHLSTLEPVELPQQLILRTTNPILLAYKYVQASPLPLLELRITQHRELEVQSAIIDDAHYQTLVTREGLAVTTARFTVRNSRQQFLRVRLPAGSEVWSAAVAGEAETPALANGVGAHDGTGTVTAGEPEVLINIIHSVQGFPVELIYATRGEAVGLVGNIESHLPRPDMVVTRTRWDVFVPDGLSYGPPETELDLVEAGVPAYDTGNGQYAPLEGRGVVDQPLSINVPASGLRFSFQMLYANQAPVLMGVVLPYASEGGSQVGLILALIGAGLLALAVLALFRRPRPGMSLIAVGAGLGVVLVAVGMIAFHTNPGPAIAVFLVLCAIGAVIAQRPRVARWWEERRQRRAEERAATQAALPAAEEPPPAQEPPPADQT